MKQICVLSGKGGTGKTSLTASLSSLAKNAVLADCDVDAADLYLILEPEIIKEEKFLGGETAFIHTENCRNCGRCMNYCRFDAISFADGKYEVSPYKCEGCKLCFYICPDRTIEMQRSDTSRWYIANTKNAPMVYAKLGVAEENSGKLVTLVRHQAKLLAEEQNRNTIIIDGPPGIGCPATSALTGVDMALIITEASISGLHDLKRLVDTVNHFKIQSTVILNKYDLNKKSAEEIEGYCKQNNIPVLAKLPFDRDVVEAMLEQKSIVDFKKDSIIAKEIKNAWNKIEEILSK